MILCLHELSLMSFEALLVLPITVNSGQAKPSLY